MDGYRDLRLVLAALRAGRVDPARLAEVGLGWTPGAATPFWEYLVERGVVAPEPATTVCLPPPAPVGGEETPSFAGNGQTPSFPAPIHPARETVAFPGAAVRSAMTGPPADPAARYAVLHKHREGGLGEVWLARDTAVGREVALKRLRPDRVNDPELRARFVREARITGQLEHPCVVPLYDLVEDAGGRGPCYVMRFVAGRTLSEAVADYHTRRAKEQAGRLELATLLDAFVAVCRAVAYAHVLGVLHRDLKGQNVVLGDFGEVFLLDWGLAKPVGEADAAPTPAPALAGPDQPTRTGAVVGTPAYMAPEVAAGGPASKASDVYGLGAVLYTILTGKPPYEGLDAWEVVEKVKASDPPPPRAVNPDAPPALEAVCRRAMARDPAGRYGTADELATEVRRWLADEPVAAYRDPWTVRATRWASRHRTTVAAAAVFLLTALVALSVSTALVWSEERRTADQKRIAEENFALARDLSFSGLSLIESADASFAANPSLQSARKELLEATSRTYRGYLEQRPDDPDLRRRTAQVYRYTANVRRLVNENDAAEGMYQDAARLLEGLAEQYPGDPLHREKLAETLRDHSQLQEMVGRHRDAADTLRRAAEVAEGLHAADPASSAYRRTLATVLLNLSGVEFARGRVADSGATAGRAADLYRGLPAGGHPLDPLLLAAALNRAAVADRETGRLDPALTAHSEAVKHLQGMIEKRPEGANLADILHFMNRCRVEQARTWAATGEPRRRANAETNLGAAIAQWEGLARDYPRIPLYREWQAVALQARGQLRAEGNRPADARSDFDKSRGLLEKLTGEFPGVPGYRGHLGRTYVGLGRLDRGSGDAASARDWFAKAEGALQVATDKGPENARDRQSLNEVRADLGR